MLYRARRIINTNGRARLLRAGLISRLLERIVEGLRMIRAGRHAVLCGTVTRRHIMIKGVIYVRRYAQGEDGIALLTPTMIRHLALIIIK